MPNIQNNKYLNERKFLKDPVNFENVMLTIVSVK